jgi:hypothetical protein
MIVYADSLDAPELAEGLRVDLLDLRVRLALSSEPGYMQQLPWEDDLVCLWVIPEGEPRQVVIV